MRICIFIDLRLWRGGSTVERKIENRTQPGFNDKAVTGLPGREI